MNEICTVLLPYWHNFPVFPAGHAQIKSKLGLFLLGSSKHFPPLHMSRPDAHGEPSKVKTVYIYIYIYDTIP